MTEEEDRSRRLHAALHDLHWGTQSLIDATGMRPETARRILAGKRWVPDWLLDWLECLAELHRQNPLPPRAQRGMDRREAGDDDPV